MPYLSNLDSTTTTSVVCSRPGEYLDDAIAFALRLASEPNRAFAYIDFNGLIITIDKASTIETARADYHRRLDIACTTAETARAPRAR